MNEDKNEPPIVWHYTKMEVLEKIFPPKILKNGKKNEDYKNGKITFRLTNVRFLSDPSEGLVFKKKFEEGINKISEHLPNIPKSFKNFISKIKFNKDLLNIDNKYIFSASYLEDSFGFWNKEYAGLDGIAIGIKNLDLYLKKRGEKIFGLYFDDVVYVEEELIKGIIAYIYAKGSAYGNAKELINNITKGSSCIFKHYSWRNEKEVRIVVDSEKEKELDIDSRIEFNGNKIKKFLYIKLNKNIISYIMLGPACNEEEVNAVKDYLKHNGYGEIPILKSHAFDLKYSDFKG